MLGLAKENLEKRRRPLWDSTSAAICHGPWLLAAAGVVSERRLTSYWQDGVPEDIRAAGGKWEDAPVVVDGNLVTSRWPPDIPVFTGEMMRLVRASQSL